uniref:Ig-like domain-containing protein n=1 Tax=Equus asinus asinus TaxID=83772 RepID=A0A8C4LQ50_EQUAS
MGTRILCWLTLCLLGADHTKAGVSQSPRHRVTERGQDVAFKCDPISGHTRLYWYRQTRGQGLEFLMYFQDDFASDTSGMLKDQFSAERPEGSSPTLKIQHAEQGDSGNIPDRFSAQQFSDYSSELDVSSLELEDSALYLCASSSGTALWSSRLQVLKPSCPS